MNNLEIMKVRHSVRSYLENDIYPEDIEKLQAIIDEYNSESGLSIELCLNDPDAFNVFLAKYGKFENVQNYIAMVGKDGDGIAEKVGYYGEKIVLKATEMGLGTCWVAGTYSKSKCKCKIGSGEKLYCVITIGNIQSEGVPHKSKPIEKLCRVDGDMTDWFENGMIAAQLAPTAINQQKFTITLNKDGSVSAKAGLGVLTELDLGIVKYHFELGADKSDLIWR